jgi:cell division protein FtsN
MDLQTFLVRVDLKEKGVWYRVMIGCFPTQAAADRLIAEKKLSGVESAKIRYANLVGIYGSAEERDENLRRLSDSGYSPYVIEKGLGRSYLYVGAFFRRSNAESLQKDLASSGISSKIVQR